MSDKTNKNIQIQKFTLYKREKCRICGRKVNHLGIICECGEQFCMDHRMPEDHDCKFDFKTYGRNKLLKSCT